MGFQITETLTSQARVNRNVANEEGRIFVTGKYLPALGAGASKDFIVETGEGRTSVDWSVLGTTSELTVFSVFRDTDYTLGDDLPSAPLNDNVLTGPDYINVLKEDPVINNDGTNTSNTRLIGASSQGQSTNVTSGSVDIPIILRPNTVYMFRFTNEDSSAAQYQITAQLIK